MALLLSTETAAINSASHVRIVATLLKLVETLGDEPVLDTQLEILLYY